MIQLNGNVMINPEFVESIAVWSDGNTTSSSVVITMTSGTQHIVSQTSIKEVRDVLFSYPSIPASHIQSQ